MVLRKYALRGTEHTDESETQEAGTGVPLWKQASWAFEGGLNNHSRAAKRRLGELVVARVVDG